MDGEEVLFERVGLGRLVLAQVAGILHAQVSRLHVALQVVALLGL